MIAGGQRVRDRLSVVFYEPNGLQHGGFAVFDHCGQSVVLRRLVWDLSYEVLAVLSEDLSDNSQMC